MPTATALRSILASVPDYYHSNLEVLQIVASTRRRGIRWLLAAVVAYGSAIAYIAWRTIVL